MSQRRTSKLQRFRAAIRALLVSEYTDPQTGEVLPPIWEEGAVIAYRQADIWRELALAVGAARHGIVCSITVEVGDGLDEDALETDLTVAVTICAPYAPPGEEPEEILFEETLERLQGAVPTYEGGNPHVSYRLRYQGWANALDIIPDAQLEVFQVARQFTFKARFSQERATT